MALVDEKRFEEASRIARELARIDPASPLFAAFEGKMLEHRGLLGEAAGAYRRAVELSPDAARHHFVLALAEHSLANAGRADDVTLSADALEALCVFPWPGNVRQLLGVLGRALSLLPDGGKLRAEHLPGEVRSWPMRGT